MHDPQTLNERFGIAGKLSFREAAAGIVVAEIDNAQAVASICLQGGHVMSWRPKSQAEPVVWLSPLAKLAPSKSIRGGVPVCWPWFGPHAKESGYPGHGFARTVPWNVTATGSAESGATRIVLELEPNEQTRAMWPHESRCVIEILVGETLKISLVTDNLGEDAFVIGEALHTYFRIGDIADVRVLGLDGCAFVDKVDDGKRKTQEGAVTFDGETDRVYLDTTAECTIEDPRLKRRIRIAKDGSASTVIWTPWAEKADKMGDFGPDGWRAMVCVESANALDDVVKVPAGERHTLAVEYRAETL
ncbi:MAG: D-hexose-6-phosphate mutarotase [Chromatiales bacterium]|nr:D-hexose-6-phosphate mutarotase [Chromatiales bacterium]